MIFTRAQKVPTLKGKVDKLGILKLKTSKDRREYRARNRVEKIFAIHISENNFYSGYISNSCK